MKEIFLQLLSLLPLLSTAQDPKILEDKTLLVNRIFVDGYHKMSSDSLMQVFLPMVWAERDSLVGKYPTRVDEQAAIRYYYGQALFSLSESMMQSVDREQPWKQLADAIFRETALPTLEELEQSKAAGWFLESYMRNQLRELFLQAGEKQDQGDLFMEQQFGQPVDSLKAFAAKHGELALGILYAEKCLPPPLAAYYLSMQLASQMDKKNLGLGRFILMN